MSILSYIYPRDLVPVRIYELLTVSFGVWGEGFVFLFMTVGLRRVWTGWQSSSEEDTSLN